MRRINSFIACSFGKSDVDEIYNNCILSALNDLEINPLRIDKIDFVGKIDTKIISIIKNSDFCIADLSYARPSVYYEAGFCEGLGKKVIYIARKDHFHPKKSDSPGNYLIHFDLITQNIIQWTSPNEIFISKLKKRIKLVTASIKCEIQETDIFNKYSIDEKLFEINNIARQFASELNYTSNFAVYNLYYSSRIKNNFLWIITRNNFPKSQLEEIYPYTRKIYNNLIRDILLRIPDNSSFTVIINTLKEIESTNIEYVFDLFQKHHKQKEFTYTKDLGKIFFRFIFLDEIKSFSDYRKRLSLISKLR